MTHQTYAEEIAAFTADLTIDDVPEEVTERARLHALDALGIALASSTTDFGTAIHQAARQLGTGDDAGVVGFGTRLPAASAALANGTLIHGLDFDDTHIRAVHHASAPALATALAVAEERGSTGQEALLAYVIGLEIGCRLAGAVPGELHDRGFHPTGIMGTFAAVAAAARLRKLEPAATVRSLGLAGSQAAGILEINGSWLKRLHPGWAAHSGIVAATMGAAGFAGPGTVFEGVHGVYQAHVGRVPDRAETGLDTLGSRWATTEIALKPYPCCHFTHAFIDAALAVRDELHGRGVRVSEIACIEAPTSERLLHQVTEPRESKIAPRTIYDALFSIQYATALALVTGRVDLAAFYDERYDDPEVLSLAAKVTCPVDRDSDYPAHFPGEVIIRLGDGTTVARRVPASRGTPDNPLTTAEVVAKFTTTAGRAVPQGQADTIAAIVLALDKEPDLGSLVKALTRS
ncbi:MmgE/PrpD family protein [Amycolatopsis thermophila]|uniref:2-methylcitrate dehydratase PrpD n=1 Tax=Amycolatopsis thermophila TaxID=206084 RepID=A0ABU0F4H5_9PSEU|nr:MmgE/PrpD family protein [Amycolatopsis thermophila]MDQ0382486.1 2-methylcitrate dehydratase PrpD [Amycolatopsis thermophila]